MPLELDSTRKRLQDFDIRGVFIEELGWSHFSGRTKTIEVQERNYELTPIAELSGVAVFEVTADNGEMPDAKERHAVHKQVAAEHREHLLVFLDRNRTASDWYWVKRDGGKEYPRDHFYFRGQTGDLILSKLHDIFFDLADFDDEGNVPIVEVTRRISAALDIDRVTKKFYGEFKKLHVDFVRMIKGIDDEHDRKWYASVILNRLMFIYFLQKKRFIDKNTNYLNDKLVESQKRGTDRFFSEFLHLLFFEGFAKNTGNRNKKAARILGDVRYLNGGLFLRHSLEQKYEGKIKIPDVAFEDLLALFGRYSWHLDDRPSGKDDEISPDVLGYIFEKYINQKQFGAYYTRSEITEYLCDHTVNEVIVRKLNERLGRKYESVEKIILEADVAVCRALLGQDGIMGSLSLLDPACGSGAFLVAAMKTLVNIYSALIGKIEFLKDDDLNAWLRELQSHRSIAYEIKKRIITDNLYGVDIMEEAIEICKLRLFLSLVASVERVSQLEPLPNIDFNVMTGNSLIGMLRVEEGELSFFTNPTHYRDALKEKNRLIDDFRHATSQTSAEDMEFLKSVVEDSIGPLREALDNVLFHRFSEKKIYYHQAVSEKKFEKRHLRLGDIQALKPFHWCFEFDEIMQNRGGFDAIITNPPWEIFKPNAKEFFQEFSDEVTKKKMTIKEFKKVQTKLLENPETEKAWLEYLSRFRHQSAYFRTADQYCNQIGKVDGKKVGSDINYYKLFLEQCHNLLGKGGRCGIICSSGVYTDLGAKQIRALLFDNSRVVSLFGLSNEKFIFEGVHHAQKICILTFEKGGTTDSFSAAFRINPREAIKPEVLGEFLRDSENHLTIETSLVKKLSPDSFSIMEFKTPLDIEIAKKMLRFPLLGEHIEGKWNLKLYREFDMTNDSHLFHTEPGPGRLPLYEGKMIWQYAVTHRENRFWIQEEEGKEKTTGKRHISPGFHGWQSYRIGVRAVSASTNVRTLVCSILPPGCFCGNSVLTSVGGVETLADQVFLSALLNSFCVDSFLRKKVSQNVNMFFLYQLPAPRFEENEENHRAILSRAARLVCTTPEFDDLAKEVGLGSHRNGATDPDERARLRAELDGLIAHLYGLTEGDFTHILSTFPLVDQKVKDNALAAYRVLATCGS